MTQPASDLATDALECLQRTWGYSDFRPGQAQIVEQVAAGGDALVLMPTGGGKSLCYQLPALLRHAQHGTTVVVSPLIALMHDQVGALRELGVAAAMLNSSVSAQDAAATEQALIKGELAMVYIAPERLVTTKTLALLDAARERGRLSLFAIDEAHCVSQWGHEFRPEYRALAVLADRYAGVPRIALTATADGLTQQDMVERLQLQQAQVFTHSFDRPNIHYRILNKDDGRSQLLKFLRAEHAGDAGIVYALSRKKVDDTAAWLSAQGVAAMPYHAGMSNEDRQRNQERFLREDGWVMVATVAFGMGIDKPDVRFVAHLDMPKNIEGYYQETGRAGRDGEPATAWMLYGLQDVVQQRRMIDEGDAPDAFKQVLRDKLDALLSMAEATDCRRVRLLAYFGEASQPCGNCDNCLNPAPTTDVTVLAQQLLSCVYRVQQASGIGFGAGHIMDIVRGKRTDKVLQHGHEALSTFGLAASNSEAQLRTVLRHLVGNGALKVDAEHYNTLSLRAAAKPILKGEQQVLLREAVADTEAGARGRGVAKRGGSAKVAASDPTLGAEDQALFESLKAWRREVADANNLPAFVILHDSTLRALAQIRPQSAGQLASISGIGEKKIQAYGDELLRVCRSV